MSNKSKAEDWGKPIMKNMRVKCKKEKIKLKKEIKISNKDKMENITQIQDQNKMIGKMSKSETQYRSRHLLINSAIMLKTKISFLRFWRSWWVSKLKGTEWKRNSPKNKLKCRPKRNHQVCFIQKNNTVKIIWKITDSWIKKMAFF